MLQTDLLTKTSEHPLSSTGNLKTNSLASAIGISSSRNSGDGSSRDCWLNSVS